MSVQQAWELYCPGCGAAQVCGPHEMTTRLRSRGLLRRQSDPELDLIVELFRGSAGQFSCARCGRSGLVARTAREDPWPESPRGCADCGSLIPAERIQLYPHATRCAACEAQAPAVGSRPDEREFCPRCGTVLQLRLSTGQGLSRYQLSCPRCKS